MSNLFAALCEVFEDELERQRNVLDVCLAQGAAARARDAAHLETKTAALAILIQEVVDAESRRMDIVRQLVAQCGLPEERQTLSALIDAAPEPWKARMRDMQKEIRKVLESVKRTVQENDVLIKKSIANVNRAMHALVECAAPAPRGYTAHGARRGPVVMQPAMMDQQG